MASVASAIKKKLVIGKQSAKGTIADAGLATAQYLRRVSSTLDVKKETYQSNEKNANRQIMDFRHGVKSVDGSISGELSPGTYELFMASVLRKDFVTGISMNVAAANNVAAASTTGAAGTFTRDDVGGSFITDGFKVGDVVRWTGWDSPATANNDHNMLITALTATVMTVVTLDGVAIATKAKGDNVACSVVGMKSWVPATAHTEDWYTIEHYFSDLDISEVFYDCKVGGMSIKLPATGMATIDFNIMGLNYNHLDAGTSPYFTAVVAEGTKGVLAAVNGAIYVNGSAVALITGMDINIAGNLSSNPVIGSNTKPDIFDGKIVVTGNMTVYFSDATMRDYFINETEVAVNAVFTTGNASNADFIAISMPRCKVGGASKDDGDSGIVMTMPFQALYDTAGDDGVTLTQDTLATTISIQDSSLS